MSRRKPVDNSTAVSLFPFLAVLLCTMGALLVVLVAVSRAAREAALREQNSQQLAAPAEPDPALQRELEEIEQFQNKVKQVRSEAEEQLRQQQLRLGELESHMRRLQDQLAVLQAAVAELDALEEDHYDDREQAEREIQRLQRLIAETREAVETVKEQIKLQNHKYALVPYEGPNGTYRRPLYIECRKNELILQPEGVRVTKEDLYPPFGAGNPLSSAIRAARNYYVELNTAEGRGRSTEPYPLLVVRPEGLVMYDRARRAIEASDFDFGFELVEADWELKYPVADPKLATLEQQAIDLARIRQRALAAAAPRAYRHSAFAGGGQFEFDDDGEIGFGLSGMGDGTGDYADDGEESYDGYGEGGAAQGGSATEQNGSGGGSHIESDSSDATASVDSADGPNGSVGSPGSQGTASRPGGSKGATSAAGSNTSAASSMAGGEAASDVTASSQVVVSPDERPRELPESTSVSDVQVPRGRDWALGRKKPNAVPIRRTIQAIVRGDHVAILHENARIDQAAPAGNRIPLQGDTVESLDKVVAAVHQQIDGWGMAGDGLYWRPVLILNVGPDGVRRAEDLQRLLKDSGIEVRAEKLASNSPQGKTGATPSR